jgi:PST family polysaccharide transporter
MVWAKAAKLLHYVGQERRVLKNAFFLALTQGANYGFALISVPLLARRLSPDGYGVVALSIAINGFLWLIVDWGFALGATREVARSEGDGSALSATLSETLGAKMLLAVVAGLVFTALGVWNVIPHFEVLAASAILTLIGAVIACEWLFQGLQTMGSTMIASLVARGTPVILVLLFVTSPREMPTAVLIQGFGGLLYGFMLIALSLRVVQLGDAPSLRTVSGRIAENRHYFFTQSAWLVYALGAPLSLSLLSGDVQVGLFAAGEKIVRVVSILPAPLATALFPRVNHLMVASPTRAARLGLGALALQLTFGAVAALVLFVAAPLIVRTVLGAAFMHAIPVLRILSVFPLLIGITGCLSNQFLIPLGQTKAMSHVAMGASASYVVMLLIASHFWGAVGAALALITAEAITVAGFVTILVIAGRNHVLGAFVRA